MQIDGSLRGFRTAKQLTLNVRSNIGTVIDEGNPATVGKTIMARITEVTINYSPRRKPTTLPIIRSSADSENCFRKVWSKRIQHIEEMYLLLIDRANQVTGYMKVSMGGVSSTLVDPKVIFQAALKANSSGIIIAHNHPSGNIRPSENDIRLTRRIREAAGFMEISFLDHLIMTKESYFSFADDGIL